MPDYRIQAISKQESIVRCEKSVGPHRHDGVEKCPIISGLSSMPSAKSWQPWEQLVSHCQEAGGGLIQMCMCPTSPLHMGKMSFQTDAEVCRQGIRRAPRGLQKWGIKSSAQGDCLMQSALICHS